MIYKEDLLTTGTSNEIHKVTIIYKSIVKDFGFNNNNGKVSIQVTKGHALDKTQWGSKFTITMDMEFWRLVKNGILWKIILSKLE